MADRKLVPRDPWDVPAVVAGMEKLLARRAELLAEGATPIGWKLAFGTPAAMEKLGTTGPLVGFLTDATLLADGGRVLGRRLDRAETRAGDRDPPRGRGRGRRRDLGGDRARRRRPAADRDRGGARRRHLPPRRRPRPRPRRRSRCPTRSPPGSSATARRSPRPSTPRPKWGGSRSSPPGPSRYLRRFGGRDRGGRGDHQRLGRAAARHRPRPAPAQHDRGRRHARGHHHLTDT